MMRPETFAVLLSIPLLAAPLAAQSVGRTAPDSVGRSDRVEPDHLDCAAHYGALSLALPYLPGVVLMFRIAPRASYAWRAYRESTPAQLVLPRRGINAEVERRKQAIMAAHEAGQVTLQAIIDTVHLCDARYGLAPSPIRLFPSRAAE
jgi:hypothetical protein